MTRWNDDDDEYLITYLDQPKRKTWKYYFYYYNSIWRIIETRLYARNVHKTNVFALLCWSEIVYRTRIMFFFCSSYFILTLTTYQNVYRVYELCTTTYIIWYVIGWALHYVSSCFFFFFSSPCYNFFLLWTELHFETKDLSGYKCILCIRKTDNLFVCICNIISASFENRFYFWIGNRCTISYIHIYLLQVGP